MPRTHEGLVRLIERHGTTDPRVIEAFRLVARRDFVPPALKHLAYGDRPVGLPQSQTTSQPSLIARMLEAAAPAATDRALEVGTGYGYQTALLAHLVAEVVSIERRRELVDAATENLRRAGVAGAEVRHGDGFAGAADRGPYDVIVVSAAASRVPEALVDQLAEGGRLVIPVRDRDGSTDNVMSIMKRDGVPQPGRLITPARFVPLVPGPVED
ncbi:MAG: protein-L-isoaspartate(D-aspartate) O-methyltransferase [Actinobacteria bacterium]|nr:protein-L-isoaspartate(D-aspartate) O-methyltransferase [Actinomycetota bacterium]